MAQIQLTAHIERDTESGLYLGSVPSIVGAHSQARTLDELKVNLKEVVALCFEEMTPEEIAGVPWKRSMISEISPVESGCRESKRWAWKD